jgi:predicted transcriptional regulator
MMAEITVAEAARETGLSERQVRKHLERYGARRWGARVYRVSPAALAYIRSRMGQRGKRLGG